MVEGKKRDMCCGTARWQRGFKFLCSAGSPGGFQAVVIIIPISCSSQNGS